MKLHAIARYHDNGLFYDSHMNVILMDQGCIGLMASRIDLAYDMAMWITHLHNEGDKAAKIYNHAGIFCILAEYDEYVERSK